MAPSHACHVLALLNECVAPQHLSIGTLRKISHLLQADRFRKSSAVPPPVSGLLPPLEPPFVAAEHLVPPPFFVLLSDIDSTLVSIFFFWPSSCSGLSFSSLFGHHFDCFYPCPFLYSSNFHSLVPRHLPHHHLLPPQVTSSVTCMGNQLVGVEWNCKWHNVQLGQKLPWVKPTAFLTLTASTFGQPKLARP